MDRNSLTLRKLLGSRAQKWAPLCLTMASSAVPRGLAVSQWVALKSKWGLTPSGFTGQGLGTQECLNPALPISPFPFSSPESYAH